MAAGIPPVYAAPMSAGFHTMARGGSPEDAIKAAATVVAIDKVGVSVAKAAQKAGFSAAEVAAAQSAAQSAVATAAAGGDISAVLQAAAIGSVGGVAGTEVFNKTQNAALATFTQVTVVSALRGQKIDEAILNGASAATVAYLRQIQDEQKKADQVLANRDQKYSEYAKKVDEYNSLADRYNASTSQAQADDLKRQLDAKLNEINALSNVIGSMNQQLADMQGVVDNLTKKAQEEIEKAGGDYAEQAIADINEQQQALINQIQEVAQRGFGEGEGLQFAQYDTGTRTDVPRIDIFGVPQIIYEGDTVNINEAGIVFDKQTGQVVGELNQSELRTLYQNLNLPFREDSATLGGQFLPGGTEGQPGGGVSGSGASAPQPVLGGLGEFSLQEIGVGGGSAPYQSIVGDFSSRFADLSAQINQSTAVAQDMLIQQQFYAQQVQQAQAEKQRLEQLKQQAQQVKQQAPTPAAVQEADRVIEQLTQEQERVDAIEKQAQQLAQEAENAAAQEDARRQAAEEQARLVQQELEAIRIGRQERTTAAMTERERRELEQYERDMAEFEAELERLEADLAKAQTDAETARLRQQFVTQQRQRLSKMGRFTGELEAQTNRELENLLAEYERAAQSGERISGTLGEMREAPPTLADAGRGISDEEIIRLLGLGEEEIGRYGFERGTGTGDGLGGGDGQGLGGDGEGEGEIELGGGDGDGEPTEEGVAEGAAGTGAPDTVMATTVGLRPRPQFVGRGQTPGFGTRVTGESLTGILGEKEPLFGGDDDDQRAVWNRRSLRLRKALGL